MKLLIISRTPWNDSSSFGNTFSNLFSGMEDMEIFHICCQSGASDNQLTVRSFQMTEESVLKSIFGRPAGKEIHSSKQKDPDDRIYSLQKNVKRWPVFYIARDLIWKAGRWKKSPELLRYLQSFQPDVIYLPLYASWYMCDVQQYIVDYYKTVPAVGHISDDIYSLPEHFLTPPLFLLYRVVLRKKLRKLMTKARYLEVFAENMQEEYPAIFGKECYLIGKGVDPDEIGVRSVPVISGSEKAVYVYTGNIGDGRFKVLAELGKAIDRVYGGEAELRIYTATALSGKMRRAFAGIRCLRYMGSVSAPEIKEIRQAADFLVHVEDFSKKAVFAARMSFSTKIIDYLMTGRPLIAIGPAEVNSMQVLAKKQAAVTINAADRIEETVRRIRDNGTDWEFYGKNAAEYLKQNRDIRVIQKGMYDRLKKTAEADS